MGSRGEGESSGVAGRAHEGGLGTSPPSTALPGPQPDAPDSCPDPQQFLLQPPFASQDNWTRASAQLIERAAHSTPCRPWAALLSGGTRSPTCALAVHATQGFQDGMVLPYQGPCVSGSAGPGTTVTLRAHPTHSSATPPPPALSGSVEVGANCSFTVCLPPLPGPSAVPYHFRLSDGNQTAALKQVWLGDVYFCVGQSNMDFRVVDADTHPVIFDAAHFRLFQVSCVDGAVPHVGLHYSYVEAVPHTVRANTPKPPGINNQHPKVFKSEQPSPRKINIKHPPKASKRETNARCARCYAQCARFGARCFINPSFFHLVTAGCKHHSPTSISRACGRAAGSKIYDHPPPSARGGTPGDRRP